MFSVQLRDGKRVRRPKSGLMTSTKFPCLCCMALPHFKECWETKSNSMARGKGDGFGEHLFLPHVKMNQVGQMKKGKEW